MPRERPQDYKLFLLIHNRMTFSFSFIFQKNLRALDWLLRKA